MGQRVSHGPRGRINRQKVGCRVENGRRAGETIARATRQCDERTAGSRWAKRPLLQQERIKNNGLTGAWNYVQVVVGSKLRAEVTMKSGHSFWAKYREAGEIIDLDGLFSSYWSSNDREFTVLSQSLSQSSSYRSD